MSDMLSLMYRYSASCPPPLDPPWTPPGPPPLTPTCGARRYRYSVDTLGSVIAPITIAVLYMFKEEFEIGKLYAMRASDLRFFMLFSLYA